jgi:hypothetical protein
LAVRARLLLPVAVPGLLFAHAAAHAAHPLQTEDTGTQGTAKVEIENGFSRARFDATTLAVYQPQLSLGVATTVDAIVQPAVERLQAQGQPTVAGLGDTNLDGKWRFRDQDPWSLAIRAGLLLPTGKTGLSLLHGEVSGHALLVASWHDGPSTVHANLGLTREPRAPGTRLTVAHLSAAVMQAVGDRLILAADGGIDQDPAAARKAWRGSALAGVIWTARPGLDLDVGYRRNFNAPSLDRQWLAGLTYRFAL